MLIEFHIDEPIMREKILHGISWYILKLISYLQEAWSF